MFSGVFFVGELCCVLIKLPHLLLASFLTIFFPPVINVIDTLGVKYTKVRIARFCVNKLGYVNSVICAHRNLLLWFLVEVERLELSTYCVQGSRSPKLSYTPIISFLFSLSNLALSKYLT